MSSLQLSERQQKMCLKKKTTKKQTIKTTLTTPYQLNWPNIPQKDEEVICKEIQRLFTSLQLSKPRRNALGDTSSMTIKEKNALKKKKFKEIWARSEEHRRHLTLGLPQAIRYLEKKELCALLVCRDISPFMIIDPVLTLCSSQVLCAAAIHNLGGTLQTTLNFKSCRALGFKKSVANDATNVFHKLYILLKEKASPLPIIFEPEQNIKEPHQVTTQVKSITDAVKSSAVKNYSHLYIKKKDVEPLVTNKSEEFLAIDLHPVVNKRKHEDDGEALLSGHLRKKYRGMKFKQLRLAEKLKK